MSTRRPRTAAIIAVGSEMLTPFRVDTNSLYVTERLNDVGVQVSLKIVAGDNRGELAEVVGAVLARADIVVLSGGLGPTDDDVTRDAVADVLGLPLEEDPELVEHIRRRFEARRLEMPAINRRQALVPRGAIRLDNPNGTAAGLWIRTGDRHVVLLPGPPRELKPMFDRAVSVHLEPSTGGARVYRRVLRITGRSESHVDALAQPIYGPWASRQPSIETTILAVQGQIELHLSTSDERVAEAEARLGQLAASLEAALAPAVYSSDGRTLEEVVGHLLAARGYRIALAESCTGGLLASRLTDVAGSSAYVERGVVTYSNEAKTALLGVPESMLAEHGAVSEPVAAAMATGVRERAGTEVAVGITGIAGPGGGSVEKPVGTVFVAVAISGEQRVQRFDFVGPRSHIKYQASQAAMDMVRRWLLER
jgi:nicotinamide-nucleotide amidase